MDKDNPRFSTALQKCNMNGVQHALEEDPVDILENQADTPEAQDVASETEGSKFDSSIGVVWGETRFSVEYLTDMTSPWTATPSVLVLQSSNMPASRYEENCFTPTERMEIILEVAKRFKEECPKDTTLHPVLYFDGQRIHVWSITEELMESFWKSPPLFQSHPMKVISKGFPAVNVSVYIVSGLGAMPREELLKRLHFEGETKVKLVLADFEISETDPLGFIVSGELKVFTNDKEFGSSKEFGKVFPGCSCRQLDYQDQP